jgi:hypothetical protein
MLWAGLAGLVLKVVAPSGIETPAFGTAWNSSRWSIAR